MEKPTEYTLTWEVTDEMTAKRIGSAGSKILSTPNMVALMEGAALELAKAYLDEGMTTQNRKASLKERFRIMAQYYGLISTAAYHVWFVLRAVLKK